MTSERLRWWNSLPTEEKRVRQIYRYTKKEILNFTDHDKKYVIKALRKQIAMRPVIKKEFKMFRYCPTCDCILNVSRTSPNCDRCGQKLRWK